MWYVLLYMATLYAIRACHHVLGSPDAFSPYFHDKYVSHLWLVRCHGVTASLTLLLGPWLLSGWMRRCWPHLHRRLGKLYFAALIPAVAGGLVLSLMAFGGVWPRTALSLLSLGWGWTAWQACQAVRNGHIDQHQAWMLRHYSLTLAAVSLRIQSALYCGLGADFPSIYGYLAWLSWVPNLLLAEILIRWQCRSQGNPRR